MLGVEMLEERGISLPKTLEPGAGRQEILGRMRWVWGKDSETETERQRVERLSMRYTGNGKGGLNQCVKCHGDLGGNPPFLAPSPLHTLMATMFFCFFFFFAMPPSWMSYNSTQF